MVNRQCHVRRISTSDFTCGINKTNKKNHKEIEQNNKQPNEGQTISLEERKSIIVNLTSHTTGSPKIKLTIASTHQNQKINQSNHEQEQELKNNTNTKSIGIREQNAKSLRSNLTSSYPRKALTTTLIIVGTYLICWMPGVIFIMLTCQDGCPFPLLSISYKFRVLFGFITNGLITLKSIVDPFIYTVRMKEINSILNRYACLKRKSSNNYGGTSVNFSTKDGSETK